jgi:hypothetical protein
MQGQTRLDGTARQRLVLPNKPRRSSPLLVPRGEKCKRTFHQASPSRCREHGRRTAGATSRRPATERLLTDRIGRWRIAFCPCRGPASRRTHARCCDGISGSARYPHCNLPAAFARSADVRGANRQRCADGRTTVNTREQFHSSPRSAYRSSGNELTICWRRPLSHAPLTP